MGMWEQLCDALRRLGRAPAEDLRQRRTAKTQARFWAELREGEREAEVRSRESRDERAAARCADGPTGDTGSGGQTAPGRRARIGRSES